MPKEIRSSRASSIHQSRASPYPCRFKNRQQQKLDQSVISHGNEKEWEEIRCPICIDHPHNAVLLICSSNAKGCRPYMCNSSRRHSNCLSQFRKSSSSFNNHNGEVRSITKPALQCPLCRGKVSEVVVIEPAREFMNSKPRTCSLEACEFNGTYSELRKHARLEHPTVHPSNTDPTRQTEWVRLNQEVDFQDFISAAQLGHNSEEGFNVANLFDWAMDVEEILSTVDTHDSDYRVEWNDDSYLGMDLEVPFSILEFLETNDHNMIIQMRPRTTRTTHGSQSTTQESYSSRETWQNQRGSMPHYSGGRDDGATSRPPSSPDTWFYQRP